MVERGRRRRPYKTCGEAATTTLGLKGRQTYKPSGPTGRSILRTFPSEPYEPGLRSGPSSRPLPSRCARHPPPGRGWAGNMEERNVASIPAYPIWWGRKETTTFKLASHRSSGGRGTTKWWRGGRRRRPYKTCGEAATTTLGLKGRQTYKPSGPTGRFILRTFPL